MSSDGELTPHQLGERISDTARKLGYEACQDPFAADERSDVAWTFVRRTGPSFRSEILSCMVRLSPIELMVNYLGSDLAVEELAAAGAVGNAVLFNLFDYQFYRLGRPFDEILPKVIEFTDQTAVGVLSRLESEMNDVENSVWADLRRVAVERGDVNA